MHPLSDNLKGMSFEDLEKRSAAIHKRMQILRRNGITTPEVWQHLEMLLDSIHDDTLERAMLLNDPQNGKATKHVVVNTDPLEDDEPMDTVVNKPKTFNPIT